MKKIEVSNETYEKIKDQLTGKERFIKAETDKNGNEYVIVRTYSAGVFAGYINHEQRNGKEALLYNARRLWYWSGAASLSQLAMEGVKNPDNCKFPCEVDSIILTEVIEIIPCSEKARLIIQGVKIWKE